MSAQQPRLNSVTRSVRGPYFYTSVHFESKLVRFSKKFWPRIMVKRDENLSIIVNAIPSKEIILRIWNDSMVWKVVITKSMGTEFYFNWTKL